MDEALKLGSDSAEPIEMAINSEQLQQADKALATLAYEQREAVVLHLCGKLKFRQIAKLQQVPIKTVQSRYRYGINKLRSLLNDEVVK
jgi:RNA polymerase sigma factor (sigma-70 family)